MLIGSGVQAMESSEPVDFVPLFGPVRIQVEDAPYSAPEHLVQRIDAIWAEELARRPADLTNGPVYLLAGHKDGCLHLIRSEYRIVLAHLRRPEIFAHGPTVTPLGVTGLLRCPEGYVVGRRSNAVAVSPGAWEMAPAGTLDRPNPVEVLVDELQEELGLPAAAIARLDLLGLLRDDMNGVVDICYLVETSWPFQRILEAQQSLPKAEYDALSCMSAASGTNGLGCTATLLALVRIAEDAATHRI